MTDSHLFFVIASYLFAAVALGGLCLSSYLTWRCVRADYARLFGRKDISS